MGKIIIEKLKALFHKEGVNPADWENVHPNLIPIAEFVYSHCETYSLPMTITSLFRRKIPGVSKSDSHGSVGIFTNERGEKIPYKGRAFDMSIKGWSLQDVHFLRDRVNAIFNVGALSIRDGHEREAVYEDGITAGTAPHLHFQVRP